jgi:polar amino acid transport system substrate-binding protein
MVICCLVSATSAIANTLEDIKNRGSIRVGTALNLPWAMRGHDGEMFGFEVDNASKVAMEMGVELELVEMPFGDLIPSLERGEIDMIAAGMSVLPERALRVAFSDPYMTSSVGMVVRVAALADREDVIDFAVPSVTVAAVADTTTEAAAIRGLPTADIRLYESVDAAIRAFLAGEVMVLAAETPIPELLLAENPAVFTILPETMINTGEAFAVQQDEMAMLTFLNNWISAYETAGILEASRDYWFGSDDWIGRLTEPLIVVPIEEDAPAENQPGIPR